MGESVCSLNFASRCRAVALGQAQVIHLQLRDVVVRREAVQAELGEEQVEQ